jgi:hypothetical protein
LKEAFICIQPLLPVYIRMGIALMMQSEEMMKKMTVA